MVVALLVPLRWMGRKPMLSLSLYVSPGLFVTILAYDSCVYIDRLSFGRRNVQSAT